MALGLKAADEWVLTFSTPCRTTNGSSEGFTYGPATESTVKRFQALNQLPETGGYMPVRFACASLFGLVRACFLPSECLLAFCTQLTYHQNGLGLLHGILCPEVIDQE
eukprot:1134502-Pelagomonas_calceolata.AAC.5